tara:strand:- start:304 stop:459 length:156 start_codon:yes stop_codon:yes gene_type:complete
LIAEWFLIDQKALSARISRGSEYWDGQGVATVGLSEANLVICFAYIRMKLY